jgi:excisionase family DNA binding protein
VSVTVDVLVNGIRVPLELDADALAAIASALNLTDTADTAWPMWMSVESAARYLDLSPGALHKLVARDAIPYAQEGPRCRLSFNRHDLDAWMRSQRVRPQP